MSHKTRQDYILESLESAGIVKVRDIASRYKVSPMTVRRDLLSLERRGLLVRRYGGAFKSTAADTFFSFNERLGMHKVAKKAIGLAASTIVKDNDTVFIDCGSTPYQLARHIHGRKNLRVITNSLPVVSELLQNASTRIIFIGGEINHSRRATQGRQAERLLAEYRADKAFIGADGVSVDNGLSAYHELEGAISRHMMEHAREAFLLCDSSKLGKDSLFIFKPLNAIKAVITDKRAAPDLVARFRRHGIPVITA